MNFLCSIHYDFEKNKRNHPVFHAQISNKAILIKETIFQSYRIQGDKSDMLRTFRIPSTQHDIFSVLTQISADHLLTENNQSYERLSAIRSEADFFVSAEFQSRLGIESSCMRSIRYYPD